MSDAESSTDYAVFRNHSYSMGRFNRPDPDDGSYDQTDPQSMNRYSYVLNKPLSFVDPIGLDCIYDNGDGTVTVYTGDCAPNTNGVYIDCDGCVTGGAFDSNGDLAYYGTANGAFTLDGGQYSFPGVSVTVNGDTGDVGWVYPSVAYNIVDPDAPNNGNQSSWQQKMRQASHFICGKSPGDRVAKSVLTGAAIGTVTGGIGGFVAGEVFGGEVTLGATGFVGVYLGAHVGAAVGAVNGLGQGAVLAGICYAGFQYDN